MCIFIFNFNFIGDQQSNPYLAKIRVRSINQFTPQFRQSSFTFSIVENEADQYVGVVLADDTDNADTLQGMIEYSLQGSHPFTVNSEFGKQYSI